jgi:hypothetical protein
LDRGGTVVNFAEYNLKSGEIEIESARSQKVAQQFKVLFEGVQVSQWQFSGARLRFD